MDLTREANGGLFVTEGGLVLKSSQSINSHSKCKRGKFTFNCLQTHCTFERGGGGSTTKKTRSVCGPSKPVV